MSLSDWTPSNLIGTLRDYFRWGKASDPFSVLMRREGPSSQFLGARNFDDSAYTNLRALHGVDSNDLVTLMQRNATFPTDYFVDDSLPDDPSVHRYTSIAGALVGAFADLGAGYTITVWIAEGSSSYYAWDGTGFTNFNYVNFRSAPGSAESILIDLSGAVLASTGLSGFGVTFVDLYVDAVPAVTLTDVTFRMLESNAGALQIITTGDNIYLSFKDCFLERLRVTVNGNAGDIWFQNCNIIGLSNNPFFNGVGYATYHFIESFLTHNNGGVSTFASVHASNVYAFQNCSLALTGVVASSPFTAGAVTLNDMRFTFRPASINFLSGVGVTYSTTLGAIVYRPASTGLLNVPTDMLVVDQYNDVVRYPGSTAPGSARWGNVCFVDQVFGNNATAARNGLPFLTITAALAAALAGDTVYVLPGTYNEAISIPANVSLVGLDGARVIIQRLAVVAATDLVNLAVGSRIENVTLKLTQTVLPAVQLRGVVFAITAAGNAKMRRCSLLVQNGGIAAAVTTIGVYIGGGGNADISFACIEDCEIDVDSQGAGAKDGILVDTGSQDVIVETTLVHVQRQGGAVGTYCAARVNQPGARLVLIGGVYQGPTGAGGSDVSQSLGTLALDGAALITANANGLGFTALSGTYTEWFGDLAAQGSGVVTTRFFRSGTNTVQATELAFTARANRVARAIIVRSRLAAGGGQSSVYTLRKNAAVPAPPLTATLSGGGPGGTFAFAENVSTGYVVGDTYSVQEVNSATTGVTDVQVGIEWYTGG